MLQKLSTSNWRNDKRNAPPKDTKEEDTRYKKKMEIEEQIKREDARYKGRRYEERRYKIQRKMETEEQIKREGVRNETIHQEISTKNFY